jgi:ribosomal protein S18 acetylase RimI-like enzyme
MSELRVLIDTNVFIGLEDPKLVDPSFSELLRKCAENSIVVYVHEDSLRDIQNDKNRARRDISLSKVKKFPQIASAPLPTQADLESEFGAIKKINDWVDIALVYALKLELVDFLVTNDQGIHNRVRYSKLSDRVLLVPDAVSWLRRAFDPTPVVLPSIEDVRAHQIDSRDAIFDSLSATYGFEFGPWWAKCVKQHRRCWIAVIGSQIAGLIVRKEETREEAEIISPGDRVLKLCTFKVREEHRGEKLGELLLKQALWFAQKNQFDVVYLTTYPEQDSLIQLLQYYGFVNTKTKANDELVFEKMLSASRLCATPDDSLVELCLRHYPRFVARPPARAFCVPILGDYHAKLFPEIAFLAPLPLFPGIALRSGHHAKSPGNTIRKVYLCRAQTETLTSGDLLVFYQSKTPGALGSQCITSIGVVERVSKTSDLEELRRLTAKRSVFSDRDLKSLLDEKSTSIRVIDFLLCGHLDEPFPLKKLLAEGVVSAPPQSITLLNDERFDALRAAFSLGFEL